MRNSFIYVNFSSKIFLDSMQIIYFHKTNIIKISIVKVNMCIVFYSTIIVKFIINISFTNNISNFFRTRYVLKFLVVFHVNVFF